MEESYQFNFRVCCEYVTVDKDSLKDEMNKNKIGHLGTISRPRSYEEKKKKNHSQEEIVKMLRTAEQENKLLTEATVDEKQISNWLSEICGEWTMTSSSNIDKYFSQSSESDRIIFTYANPRIEYNEHINTLLILQLINGSTVSSIYAPLSVPYKISDKKYGITYINERSIRTIVITSEGKKTLEFIKMKNGRMVIDSIRNEDSCRRIYKKLPTREELEMENEKLKREINRLESIQIHSPSTHKAIMGTWQSKTSKQTISIRIEGKYFQQKKHPEKYSLCQFDKLYQQDNCFHTTFINDNKVITSITDKNGEVRRCERHVDNDGMLVISYVDHQKGTTNKSFYMKIGEPAED